MKAPYRLYQLVRDQYEPTSQTTWEEPHLIEKLNEKRHPGLVWMQEVFEHNQAFRGVVELDGTLTPYPSIVAYHKEHMRRIRSGVPVGLQAYKLLEMRVAA